MRRMIIPTAATLAAVVFSTLAIAAPAPQKQLPKELPKATPKPAAKPTTEPAPGSIVRDELPGGWLLQIAGESEHLFVDVPGYSPANGRTLFLTAASSEDFGKLTSTVATIVGADGKTIHAESLRGYHALTGDLSPDGKNAALIAEPWEEGGNRAVLIGFSEKGQIWKRPATSGDDVLVGRGFIAEITQPRPEQALDDVENDPPSPAPESVKPEPVRFFHAEDGTPMRAPAPIAGAISRAGDGLVAVTDGKLHVYGANLAQRAVADLGFKDGFPAAAANGSLIAVADFTVDETKKEKQLLLFDGAAKKLGTISFPASAGIDAAPAPDGSTVLLTSATAGKNGPARTIETDKSIVVELADRTGKVRWKYAADRRTETEHAGSLSVSAGGKRAACGFFADDPDENPDRAVVFDEKGNVLYKAEGDFQAVWLDPTGEWLYTIEDEGLSRLKVKDLAAGTAFPDVPDSEGE